jgi:crotonobetainyl-CoA:carnitine CoA-transferase CaiB-like acyl-CoA transferase
VRISHHSQAYAQTAPEAAAAALMALYNRQVTGQGQQVDVSIEECVTWYAHYFTGVWDTQKRKQPRGTGMPQSYNLDIPITRLWPCKDGYVSWVWWGQGKRSSPPMMKWLVEWTQSQGWSTEFEKEWDWAKANYTGLNAEAVTRLEAAMHKFLMAHTRKEILEGALKRHVQIYPVATAEDIVKGVPSEQLDARRYWTKLEHPELHDTITYPGAFVQASEEPLRILRRAPLIGEHNREIFEDELGISKEQLITLKQTGVI